MIKFTDEISVEPYAYGWIMYTKRKGVSKRTTKDKKAGEETVVVDESFHGSLEKALKVAGDEFLKKCASASDILSAIKELNTKIDKLSTT